MKLETLVRQVASLRQEVAVLRRQTLEIHERLIPPKDRNEAL